MDWKCPHGYKHQVEVVVSPKSSKVSSTIVSVKAKAACPWCKVELRRVMG